MKGRLHGAKNGKKTGKTCATAQSAVLQQKRKPKPIWVNLAGINWQARNTSASLFAIVTSEH